MPRQYQGATDVAIPIAEIMEEVSGWADEITDAIAREAVKEIRRNAQQFNVLTGNLKKSIRKKKSRINRGEVIAGAMAPHAHLLEYGHLKVLWGNRTGEHVPGTHFVGKAEDVVRAQAVRIAREVVQGKTIIVGR